MSDREHILEIIRAHLPPEASSGFAVDEESALAALGLTSLHLITVVLALQNAYGLQVDQLVEAGMPVTVGELVALVERYSGRDGLSESTPVERGLHGVTESGKAPEPPRS